MTTFDDREQAFEAKFAHDAEMAFRAEARRNRLFGQWAAGLLGRDAAGTEAYVAEVMKADFQEAGHEDVLRKVIADLAGRVEEQEVRAKFGEFLSVAKGQLASEA